ncbi:hypothetical protein PpBr36_04061 [Pyricularia pennisetigena]|uniref:hypothetical protein n=1 Tax=Pyricularia pennisetigena TaxID=1578925 RepID=UPI0011516E38|nr:hypothetical protein PpBr36_04061 [Pyricularia pennisetigena]TLS27154.1 hypothetical protein PpBr36_04061 [Pyricularia pennisetigena]
MSEFGEGLFADFRPGSNNKSVQEQTIAGKFTSTPGCPPSRSGSFMDVSREEDVGARSAVRLQRKRRRPALACDECRRRKVKCDRAVPCTNCVRHQCADACSYHSSNVSRRRVPDSTPPADPESVWPPRAIEDLQTPAANSGSSNTGVDGRSPSSALDANVTSLNERIRELEERLSRVQPSAAPDSSAHDAARSMINRGAPKGILAKTRYFGVSHWMHSAVALPLIIEVMNSKGEQGETLYSRLSANKRLGRRIKSARMPVSASHKFSQTRRAPCSRDLCDQLVDNYFRTFETIYRILHVPKFRKEYLKYWEDPTAVRDVFLIQLQLVLTIGACLHDDIFSLRNQANEWLFDAQHWITSPTPTFKARLSLDAMQSMCLLHIARETTGVGADLTWISAGELLRNAIFMGLHRDPDKLSKMPTYRAEIRRRLWATILEMALQASIDSGGPASISLSDFDTKPPSNFDDTQLDDTEGEPVLEAPQPMPTDHFTQTSVQIALHKSFPTRLAIAQYLNDFRSNGNYSTTLRLNTEMTAACRTLSMILRSFRCRDSRDSPESPTNSQHPSEFQILMTELITHRYFLALHMPWQTALQRDPSHYFSRKVSVETAMMLYRSSCTHGISEDGSAAESVGRADFARLSICGSGIYRNNNLQNTVTLATELIWQLREERATRTEAGFVGDFGSPGPDAHSLAGTQQGSGMPPLSTSKTTFGLGVMPFADLLDALRGYAARTERRMLAGDTNTKGLIFVYCVLSQAESIQKGRSDEETRIKSIQSIKESISKCHSLLNILAARVGVSSTQANETSTSNASNMWKQGTAGTIEGVPALARNSSTSGDTGNTGDSGFGPLDIDTMTADNTPQEKFVAFGGIADLSFDMDGIWDLGTMINGQGSGLNFDWPGPGMYN